MLKDLVVYGTRPEEIKLYPFTKYEFEFCEVNQSPDLHQGLIEPDYRIKEEELEDFIKKSDAKRIVVQGDTRTAFRAAVCAFENKKEVVHIEAGMRTFDLSQPFPEEGYRQMIDCIATHKFSSTPEAAKNCNGIYVGQTSIDTLFEFLPPISDEGFTLVTLHRNESYERLPELINEIKNAKNPIIIAHPNKVGQALKARFNTINPVPYKTFLKLLASCSGIMTDSGGLQEEAIAIGKPIVVLREKSERSPTDIYEKGATERIMHYLSPKAENPILYN